MARADPRSLGYNQNISSSAAAVAAAAANAVAAIAAGVAQRSRPPVSAPVTAVAAVVASTAAATLSTPSPSRGAATGGAFYFTLEQIKTAMGPDAAREETEKQRWCAFVCELAMQLAMPQLTIATATVFFHRFYMIGLNRGVDKYIVATACLFLAGKVCACAAAAPSAPISPCSV
jgi:hypothetical protein